MLGRMFALLLAAAVTDPCALLTAEEIEKVQGEKPAQAKPSLRETGDLRDEQCFYQLPTFARSISLEVMRGKGARELWRKSFKERHEEDDEEEEKPERVRGLGEEAYWSGGLRLGGLYVLKKDAVVRLSVGGPEKKEAKLKKLRLLAKRVLSRL